MGGAQGSRLIHCVTRSRPLWCVRSLSLCEACKDLAVFPRSERRRRGNFPSFDRDLRVCRRVPWSAVVGVRGEGRRGRVSLNNGSF